MFGNIINVVAIIVGSIIGIWLKKGIPDRLQQTITVGLGLVILTLGIKDAMLMQNSLFIVACMIVGILMGELLDLQTKTVKFGEFLKSKLAKNGGTEVLEGFVMASLIFDVGAMAIIGPMRSGLMHDHSILLIKALLDGTFSIIFATKYGIGITLSAITVFLYQGLMWLLSYFIKDFLNPAVVTDISAIGGVLLMGLGIKQVFDRDLKLMNMVPAMFIPVILEICKYFVGK